MPICTKSNMTFAELSSWPSTLWRWWSRWLPRGSSWTTTPTWETRGTGWISSSYSQACIVLLPWYIFWPFVVLLNRSAIHNQPAFGCQWDFSFFLTFTFSSRLPHFHFQTISLLFSGYFTFTFRLPHFLRRARQPGRPQNIQGSQGSQDCIHHARWNFHSGHGMFNISIEGALKCLLKAIALWRKVIHMFALKLWGKYDHLFFVRIVQP